MKRLSIAAMILLTACSSELPPSVSVASRPAPDDPSPSGINYICEGRKQVTVIYARNRASVTHGSKTWRMEYQAAPTGFRYFEPSHEWLGRDELASLRETNTLTPIAFNCRPAGRVG